MGHRRRGHHVRRTWTDRAGAGHHATAPTRFGKGHSGQRHRLLVMRPQRRQALPCSIQRLTQPRDIAVTENRESASKKGIFSAVDLARLRREEADERLGHREPDCGHFSSLKGDISLQGPRRMPRRLTLCVHRDPLAVSAVTLYLLEAE